MKQLVLILVLAGLLPSAQAPAGAEMSRWRAHAQQVTIIRDDWGIAHVYGKTDADAVFGLIYAQAEDDFNRVETNYLTSIGLMAQADGEKEVYRDLRQKLFIDPIEMKAQYEKAPSSMKALMNAWADGLNFFLATHPNVRPRVITRFEPWMPLTFSEGSIGGDIERVNLAQLQAFYTRTAPVQQPAPEFVEPSGSNGAAIAPSNSADHHALLLINPHTSFFFRSEAQSVSEEGLNAYGASTWGQFFVYQGFNDRIGWMHTSSGVDNIDEYAETIVRKGDSYAYKYGGEERPITTKRIVIPYKTATGMAEKTFSVYYTQHGPVVREANGKWISVRLMNEPLKALTQSYTRTKARNFKAFRDILELHTNSSNNTIYADADGNIAYFHSNFIPRRDPKFDWTKPVDGSNAETEWKGLLSVDETPGLFNPTCGWLYNSNNWPWSASGECSQKRADFPLYVDRGTEESPRGEHALRVFPGKKDFTLESLIRAAFDSYLPWFADNLPALVRAYDEAAPSDQLKQKLAEPVSALRAWDYRWSVSSIPTSVAIYWGERIGNRVATATPSQKLEALAAAVDKLTTDFGTWKTPWGDINRFQRLSDAIESTFDDGKPSIPVGFTSSRWGSLASFGARTYPSTKKMYGTSGNSFVAVVEFGDRVTARAVTAGGESGNPSSKHFNDEATRYATGDLRPVYFYKEDLKGHTERTYHPGE